VNVVILRGTLSSDPSVRTLPSGDLLATFEVTTRPPEGPAEGVPVAWPKPPKRALALKAGCEVVVTGRVRRRFFRAGGVTASRTEVMADNLLPTRHAVACQKAVTRAIERAQTLLEET
jgi:single-strand DNA-binding protein